MPLIFPLRRLNLRRSPGASPAPPPTPFDTATLADPLERRQNKAAAAAGLLADRLARRVINLRHTTDLRERRAKETLRNQ